jgi:hypothetical protein
MLTYAISLYVSILASVSLNKQAAVHSTRKAARRAISYQGGRTAVFPEKKKLPTSGKELGTERFECEHTLTYAADVC